MRNSNMHSKRILCNYNYYNKNRPSSTIQRLLSSSSYSSCSSSIISSNNGRRRFQQTRTTIIPTIPISTSTRIGIGIGPFSLLSSSSKNLRTNNNNNVNRNDGNICSSKNVQYFHSTACNNNNNSNDSQTSKKNNTTTTTTTTTKTIIKPIISIIQNMDLLDDIPLEDVRNFCFIAHVDHGKSSLASRVLELAGNLGVQQQLTAMEHVHGTAAAAATAYGTDATATTATSNRYNDSNVNDSDGNGYKYNNDDITDASSSGRVSASSASTGENEIDHNHNHNQNSNTITNVNNTNGKEQIELLDTLAVEKERGITVKASAASMLYTHPTAKNKHGVLLLNMVDTPGHVDFSTEVIRSLSSVQGAVLLFDSAQGVQAQTLSVYEKARSMVNIGVVLPVLTKVDLPSSRALDVALSVSELFDFDPDEVILTSARSRKGIAEVLDAVCYHVPPPKELPDDNGNDNGNDNNNSDKDNSSSSSRSSSNSNDKVLRAQVVDSWFEPLRGVVCLVQILSGELTESNRITILEPLVKKKNDEAGTGTGPGTGTGGSSNDSDTRNYISKNKEHYSVQDVGLVLPHRIRTGRLRRGQMGYVIVGLRDPRQARPGTIMVLHKDLSRVLDMSLPETHTTSSSQSVLYASVHPLEGEGFDELSNAIDRLALNDTGLEIQRTSGASNSDGSGGPYLGPGLRVGFQGLLHVEVFQQRLFDEFGLEAVVTPPKVPYRITYLESKSTHKQRPSDAPTTEVIEDLSKWPGQGIRFKVEEPVVDIRIMAPMEYAGNIMDLIKRKRGTGMTTKTIDELTWLFKAQMPWGEVVTDFHDELKNVSAGYASFDSRESNPPFVEASLSKVDIMLNGEVVEPLAFVCHKESAQAHGRVVCKKLQAVLPRQQFVTVIQAKADSKIIASERIRSYRKDVLTTGGSKSVGGGDITRKKKLLEKQKRGKKRQQSSGKVTLSQAAFNSVISRSS